MQTKKEEGGTGARAREGRASCFLYYSTSVVYDSRWFGGVWSGCERDWAGADLERARNEARTGDPAGENGHGNTFAPFLAQWKKKKRRGIVTSDHGPRTLNSFPHSPVIRQLPMIFLAARRQPPATPFTLPFSHGLLAKSLCVITKVYSLSTPRAHNIKGGTPVNSAKMIQRKHTGRAQSRGFGKVYADTRR